MEQQADMMCRQDKTQNTLGNIDSITSFSSILTAGLLSTQSRKNTPVHARERQMQGLNTVCQVYLQLLSYGMFVHHACYHKQLLQL